MTRYWIASIVWPSLADQQPEVGPGAGRPRRRRRPRGRRSGSAPRSRRRSRSTSSRSARVASSLSSRAAAASRRAASTGREHARRRESHAEQPALALGEHLEADRRLGRGPGSKPLELAQRVPLRLADRVAGGLDLEGTASPGGHRLRAPPFFFRFTRRGCRSTADRRRLRRHGGCLGRRALPSFGGSLPGRRPRRSSSAGGTFVLAARAVA